ncbi:MAG: hypothetical protein IPI97_06530 [Nitrosomonas sp.]|nr:hypothetical protein [Nitrosomonas sp.]MBK7364652.1 hypothetical protein [Nitrosomonas sp.]
MENSLDQIIRYFEEVPLWPFVLLAGLFLLSLSIEFINRRRRTDAVEYFDSTFLTELSGLYPKATKWPEDLADHLKESFPVMRDAFENLRGFLPQKQLREYNLAWNNFFDFCRTNGLSHRDVNAKPASDQSSEFNQSIQDIETFHKLVSDLLAYTNQFK